MLIEHLLRYCATRTTRRYLAFEPGQGCWPLMPEEGKTYLLYIHIPFCAQLCPYCSFVRTRFDPVLAAQYFEVLEREIREFFLLGYQFGAVYVGGGTPTIWPEKLVEILSLVRSLWSIRMISVEASPDHLRAAVLEQLKHAGVNRLSVGVQSFSPSDLSSVHRSESQGTGEDIRRRLIGAKGMFDTLNVDMIFGFPNQTKDMLVSDVETLRSLDLDQVTYYPMMISRFKIQEMTESCGVCQGLHKKDAYEFIVEQLTGQYRCESMWCFSKQKEAIDEYIVNHDEYVGVGPGSWGFIRGTMYHNSFSIRDYIVRGQSGQSPITAYKTFTKLERVQYRFVLGLITGSLSLADIKKRIGRSFWCLLGHELMFLFLTGALVMRKGKLVLTRRGRFYWLTLLGTMFAVVGDYRNAHGDADSSPVPVHSALRWEANDHGHGRCESRHTIRNCVHRL